MRKIYFSLITIAILLFTACTNDVPGNEKEVETGTLTATISFAAKASGELKSTRAAESTAIPIVDWDNVKQIQLFLYNASTGVVAYSKTVTPTTDNKFIYSWSDVPVGTYRLALLANVNSAPTKDRIETWVGAEKAGFTDANVLGKNFNDTYIYPLRNADLQIDLRETTLPGEETTPVTHIWKHSDLQKTGYLPPSEIFSAYSENVTITAGQTTQLTEDQGKELELLHEVSLLRARINKEVIPDQPGGIDKPTFNNASDFIAVQTLPVGFGLKVDDFAGGIFDAASNKGRVLVGSKGTTTYRTVDPQSDDRYKEGIIIKDDFKLWQDILVLPNAAESEGIGRSADAAVGRKYFIIISGAVKKDYIYADGTVANRDDQPVYWYGEIAGVFTRNIIREVNMTLKTAGYPEIPPTPVEYGGLTIELGAPIEWDATIERTDIES